MPDLTKPTADIILENDGGFLHDLKLSIKVQTDGLDIVNVKWTYAQTPQGYQQPFEVPLDIVGTITGSNVPLNKYVTVTDKPFNLNVLAKKDSPSIAFSITGMILDQHFNLISTSLNSTKADNFMGIFGLGERISSNIFYEDGVYSMWSRDIPSPEETGHTPGNNIYGTHPFYVYKNDVNQWVGVFTKLAAA